MAALSVANRDSAYRRVPATLAATPQRFAKQVETALDASTQHIQSNQQTAQVLQQTSQQLQAAVEQMRQATAPTVDLGAGVTIGRGFE